MKLIPDGCSCRACEQQTLATMRMIVCAKCGNKRCPHATDHRNECTASNEPGQAGSVYGRAILSDLHAERAKP